MDPDIRDDKRPIFASVRKSDIWGLRDNPKFDADFVRLEFKTSELSSVQADVLREWAPKCATPLYLLQTEIHEYAWLVGLTVTRMEVAPKFSRHPVNTDCREVDFGVARDNDNRSPWVCQCVSGLGEKDSVVVESGDGKAIAGRKALGGNWVYFVNSRRGGRDLRRWNLNWLHWAMGLRVPGAAETTVSGAPSSTAQKNANDVVLLKNGDNLSGTVLTASVKIVSSYSTLEFKIADIDRIQIEGGNNKTDVLQLRTGDRLSGVIETGAIKMKLVSGAETEITKDKLSEIRFRPRSP